MPWRLAVRREIQRLIQVRRHDLAVAGLDPLLDALRVHLDREDHAVVHGDGERLGATHPAQARSEDQPAPEAPAEVLPGRGGEGLVRSLEDALGADVDPAPGRHLAVHGEAQLLQLAELLPVAPGGDQHGVADQDAGRERVGPEDPDGLAGLDQQGLVVLQGLEAFDDPVIAFPVPGRLSGAAVHHQVLRPLAHLGIEVVHEHAHGRFLVPALARQGRAARRPDGIFRRLLLDHGRSLLNEPQITQISQS